MLSIDCTYFTVHVCYIQCCKSCFCGSSPNSASFFYVIRIPAEQQRLRRGFPPRELRPSEDPTHPVELTNGERVSVDVVTTSVPSGGGEKDGGGVKSEEVKEKEVEDEDDVRVKRKEQELESAQQGQCLHSVSHVAWLPLIALTALSL